MDKMTATRAGLAVIIFVMGSLQAWDSNVPSAGLLIVFLVSLAIALPPVALLVPLEQRYFLGAFALSFILLIIARTLYCSDACTDWTDLHWNFQSGNS